MTFQDILAKYSAVSLLFLVEVRLSKLLYAHICRITNYGPFTRVKRGKRQDLANRFLGHGNYLAYGLAATATWILGLPHAFAVMYGKTDVAGLSLTSPI